MVSVLATIILVVIEIIVYIFHASMLILLICKRKTSFKGAFYSIFRIVIIVDLSLFISLLIQIKLSLIYVEFFKANEYFLASFRINASTYFTTTQFLGHLLMSFNRFTVFWFPLKHKWIWNKNWYLYLLIILPFFEICYKLHEFGVYKFVDNTTVLTLFTNQALNPLSYSIQTGIYITTTLLSAVFNGLSYIKFKLSKHSTNASERSLFLVTCVIFVAQVFRISYSLARAIFISNESVTAFISVTFPFVSDIFAWAGCISLLVLSPTTRNEYLNFYAYKKSTKVQSTLSYPIVH